MRRLLKSCIGLDPAQQSQHVRLNALQRGHILALEAQHQHRGGVGRTNQAEAIVPIDAQAIDRAVFPGLQGGPHNHTTAAIAVAAHEASQPAFKASGDITSMSQADGYIEIPAQTDIVEKDELVEVTLF